MLSTLTSRELLLTVQGRFCNNRKLIYDFLFAKALTSTVFEIQDGPKTAPLQCRATANLNTEIVKKNLLNAH